MKLAFVLIVAVLAYAGFAAADSGAHSIKAGRARLDAAVDAAVQ
jgi:hypothetical protein